MLNPFIKLTGWYSDSLIGEIEQPYMEWDQPGFPNDILAFKFLRDKASWYARNGDFSSKEAVKYHTTIAFLQDVMGMDLFKWAVQISEQER